MAQIFEAYDLFLNTVFINQSDITDLLMDIFPWREKEIVDLLNNIFEQIAL